LNKHSFYNGYKLCWNGECPAMPNMHFISHSYKRHRILGVLNVSDSLTFVETGAPYFESNLFKEKNFGYQDYNFQFGSCRRMSDYPWLQTVSIRSVVVINELMMHCILIMDPRPFERKLVKRSRTGLSLCYRIHASRAVMDSLICWNDNFHQVRISV